MAPPRLSFALLALAALIGGLSAGPKLPGAEPRALPGALAAPALPVRAGPQRLILIALAGDSTVATYPEEIAQKGWGQYLQGGFSDRVVVANFAAGGRSTKTFIAEGRWAKLLLSRPDFILIQFGHNDSHAPDHPEHTDPEGLYRTLLLRMVDEARAIGATPILVTPVQRRTAKDSLAVYADAMRRVARERQVPLVDLHRLSGELYARLGPVGTAALARSSDDSTHFNAQGARIVAGLVRGGVADAVPALRAFSSSPGTPADPTGAGPTARP